MTELTNVPDQTAAEASDGRHDRQRRRLQMLRNQLSSGPDREAPTPRGRPVGRALNRARPGEGQDAIKTSAQRRAATQFYHLLTETPADNTGLVEGTPFTSAGVARALDALRARTSQEGTVGAKAAAWVLKFLAPSDGETEIVHDVSVDKLKRIARLAKALKLGHEGSS